MVKHEIDKRITDILNTFQIIVQRKVNRGLNTSPFRVIFEKSAEFSGCYNHGYISHISNLAIWQK
jgi:hypothetical protein